MNLLMWTLQFIGLVFIYVGISIPVVAYAVIVTMLCSKILHYPLRVFGYIGRLVSLWAAKPLDEQPPLMDMFPPTVYGMQDLPTCVGLDHVT